MTVGQDVFPTIKLPLCSTFFLDNPCSEMIFYTISQNSPFSLLFMAWGGSSLR